VRLEGLGICAAYKPVLYIYIYFNIDRFVCTNDASQF
jgi:hypothetical protein